MLAAVRDRGAAVLTTAITTGYPSLDAYRASLPDGWASFPTCEASAALFVGLRERGVFEGLELAPALSRYVAGSLAADAWLPEVVSVALFLAVRDARFPDSAGEQAFLAWFQALNAALLDAEYRAQPVASPQEALGSLSDTWARFHRGTSMTVTAHTAQTAEIAFAHPRLLFPPAWMESRRRMLMGALVRARAAQPEVLAAADGERGTIFRLSWT